MDLIIEKFESKHHEAAKELVRYSGLVGTMRPLSPKTMEDHRYGLIALTPQSSKGLGYVALTKGQEVGGLIVHPEAWGEGLGLRLVKHLLVTASEVMPGLDSCYAFANQYSQEVFLKAGGRLSGERRPRSPTGCNYLIDLTPAITP